MKNFLKINHAFGAKKKIFFLVALFSASVAAMADAPTTKAADTVTSL